MKKRLALLSLLLPSITLAAVTTEKLVTTAAAIRVDSTTTFRRNVEIQNNGPNTITCQLATSTGLTTAKGRKIATNGVWSLSLAQGTPVYCIAATADQLTGAATVVSEW